MSCAPRRGDGQKTIEVVRDKDGLRIAEKDDDLPEIQAFLHEMLKDDKPIPQQEVEQAAKAKGFTEKQLHAARHKLGVEIIKESGKESIDLFWRLPNFNKGHYHYE